MDHLDSVFEDLSNDVSHAIYIIRCLSLKLKGVGGNHPIPLEWVVTTPPNGKQRRKIGLVILGLIVHSSPNLLSPSSVLPHNATRSDGEESFRPRMQPLIVENISGNLQLHGMKLQASTIVAN